MATWVDVDFYGDVPVKTGYRIGSNGQLKAPNSRRNPAGRVMKCASQGGYVRTELVSKYGKRLKAMVHIIVCHAFHGPKPSEGHTVDHIDGDPSNNSASNLRWATRTEQVLNRTISKMKPRSYNLIDGEIWKPLLTYTGRPLRNGYQVSSHGRFFLTNPTKQNPFYSVGCVNKANGYVYTVLRLEDGGRVNCLVHIAVCEAFHGPRPTIQHTVDHIDRNRLNNTSDNLRWSLPVEQNANRLLAMPPLQASNA
jgi:hypothetical protein